MKQLFAVLAMLLLSASMLYAQDIIILKNGETINGKVTEVGVNEIRYYKSENLDGPVYVTNKLEIAQIAYANGNKDIFTAPSPAPVSQTNGYIKGGRRYFYRPFWYPVIIPHIDLGHHGFLKGHHGISYHGRHH